MSLWFNSSLWCLGLIAVCGASASAQTTKPQPPAGPFEQTAIKRSAAPSSPTGKSANPAEQNKLEYAKVPLALGGVILLIFALRWGGRAMLKSGGKQRSSAAIQILTQSTISPRQKLMLVRVGRRLILVGNSGAEMSALCQIDDPGEVAEVLGQLSADKSAGKSFRTMVGRAGRTYEALAEHDEVDEANDKSVVNEVEASASEPMGEPTAETREELSGLMDRVRRISQQFQKS